jgi:PleD family two-component response regulator
MIASRANEDAMERGKPSILIVGESMQFTLFASGLDRTGCDCSTATSCRQAFRVLTSRDFDLVFCPTRLRDGSLFPVMSLLRGSRTTMFYFYPVERGCWWLPALRCGEICFGSAAYRGKDFVTLLDSTIKQIQRNASAVAAQAAT